MKVSYLEASITSAKASVTSMDTGLETPGEFSSVEACISRIPSLQASAEA